MSSKERPETLGLLWHEVNVTGCLGHLSLQERGLLAKQPAGMAEAGVEGGQA